MGHGRTTGDDTEVGVPAEQAFAPPKPYLAPEGGALPCELSADCPAGTYCDLEECFQACHVRSPCPGELRCNARGQCVTDISVAPDTPPATHHVGSVRALNDRIIAGSGTSKVTLRFVAAPADVTVRYRLESTAEWLKVQDPRGEFQKELTVALTLDHPELWLGTHTGNVTLHTNVGNVTVSVILEQGLTGVYHGQLRYDSPYPLGTVPLRLAAVTRADGVDLLIDSSGSPTYPQHDEANPTFRGEFFSGQLEGTLSQSFTAPEIGADSDFFKGEVNRIFELSLTPTENGGLTGTFTDRWVGLFPETASVEGTIVLARMPGAFERPFTVQDPPEVLAAPSFRSLPLSDDCVEETEYATGGRSACLPTSPSSSRVSCGGMMLDLGTPFERGFLVMSGGRRSHEEFFAPCRVELEELNGIDNPLSSGAPIGCVHEPYMECALAYFLSAITEDGEHSAHGISRYVGSRAGIALLLANQDLTEASYTRFVQRGPADAAVVLEYDEAQRWTDAALKDLSRPGILEGLRQTRPALASVDNFRGVRRLAQLLARDGMANAEDLAVRLRARPWQRESLRQRIDRDALRLLTGLVALSTAADAQSAGTHTEFELLAQTLTQLSRRAVEARHPELILDMTTGDIPFLYDSQLTGPNRRSSFRQLFESHSALVRQAANDELSAREADRSYEEDTQTFLKELAKVRHEMNGRLVRICGPAAGPRNRPNLDGCGEDTGELAEAYENQEDAGSRLGSAMTRLERLKLHAIVEHRRLAEIQGFKKDDLYFVTPTGEKVEPLEFIYRELTTAKTFVAMVANAGLDSPGDTIAGAAGSFMDTIRQQLQSQHDQLRSMQSLLLRPDESRIEVVNGMATLRNLLLALNEVTIELGQATYLAAKAALQAEALLEQKDQTLAELNVIEERIADRDLLDDPAFRLLQNHAEVQALDSFSEAQQGMYVVARAFEIETNTDFPPIENMLLSSLRGSDVADFSRCLQQGFGRYRSQRDEPLASVTEVSLRQDILGIRGPVTDLVTGRVISEQERFLQRLLTPENVGPDGTVSLVSTHVDPGSRVFERPVCSNQIRGLRVRLIGDGLGDDLAAVVIQQQGTVFMQACGPAQADQSAAIQSYGLGPSPRAFLEAGVNAYLNGPTDTQLFGRPIAASKWSLELPSGTVAPQNADLDLKHLEDIIIQIEYSGFSLFENTVAYDPC